MDSNRIDQVETGSNRINRVETGSGPSNQVEIATPGFPMKRR